MLVLKPFPTTHKGKILLPSAPDLAWFLPFASLLVVVPPAFGGDVSVVFVGNETKGLNPHCLGCTSAKETGNVRLPAHFGLTWAALDGNRRCAGSFGALLFHSLASAVIRAIKQ